MQTHAVYKHAYVAKEKLYQYKYMFYKLYVCELSYADEYLPV